MECLDPASYQLADLDHMCFHILVTSQYFRLGGFTMSASHLRPHLKGRIREKTKTHGFANLYKPVCLVWLCVPGQPSVSQIVRLFLEGGRVLKVGLFLFGFNECHRITTMQQAVALNALLATRHLKEELLRLYGPSATSLGSVAVERSWWQDYLRKVQHSVWCTPVTRSSLQ